VRKLIVIASLAFSLTAAAAPSPEMLELGKKEFEAGSRDFDLGNYEKALEHFESAYKLTGKSGLLFNIARVHEWQYRRNRRLEDLKAAIERLKTLIQYTQGDNDPQVVQVRGRAQIVLKAYEDEYNKETGKRARGEEALKLGEDLLEAGRFTDVLAQVDKYEHASGNERPGLVRAFILRAFVSFATGDNDAAIKWFARALSLDKSLLLPEKANQKVRAVFASAQKRLEGKDVENTVHAPPAGLKPGQSIELVFATTDPEHLVASIQLRYRIAGGGAYSKMPIGASGRVTLPRPFTQGLQPGTKIEYYADVLDANGAYLEHLGTDALPFNIMVGKASINVAKRWWFWTAFGVVVAGAALGGGLGYYFTRPIPPPTIGVETGGLHSGPGLTVVHW
jgi:tetratricopeptide (TPR) repeat protein